MVFDVLILRVHGRSEHADATLELRALAIAFTFPFAIVLAVVLVPLWTRFVTSAMSGLPTLLACEVSLRLAFLIASACSCGPSCRRERHAVTPPPR